MNNNSTIPDRAQAFVIYGEPASKANSRKAVLIGGKPRFIKSKKALDYAEDFQRQIRQYLNLQLLKGQVVVHIKIWYASRRPDLDESLILDLLQGHVYENDRQVKEKHIFWGLDKSNPRSEINVWTIS